MQHGTASQNEIHPRRRSSRQVLAALVLSSALSGCVTPWEKSALLKDTTPNIEKVQGPTERRMRLMFWKRDQEALADDSNSLKPLAGTDEFAAATELYKDEEFAEAQKAFKQVAKKFKKSEIREDALFMEGEAAFQQEHYSKAHDSYATLLKEYPSTRHLDVVSERLFKIGRLWLEMPDVAKLGEIQQVNFEDPKRKLPAEEPVKPNKTPVFVPNFRDKTRPLFDTPGNGVGALQAIWMNDPTGPLADDAMMLVASHHARRGNYIEADRYFRMLRETFPSSPHLRDAFLLGSHVKLMSYQGADYDGKTLNDAEMLKKSTLRLFPDIGESERLTDELAKIEAAKAEREWQQVALWLRKGNKRAAAVMCHQLISHYPDSAQADQARAKLEKLGPEYASGAVLLTPIDPPKPTVWQRINPLARQPGDLPKQPVPATSNEPDYADDEATEESPSRWMPNPFRKKNPQTTDPVEEEPETETESAEDGPAAGKAAPRKRSWWPIPRKLPEEIDTDAKKLEPVDTSGHVKL
ncbi:MAG: tetratricopeptide repeat protein [Planctomycetes bacterium]|nr:tetratricopeptide repeat protein [Planctomycetota bacterium]